MKKVLIVILTLTLLLGGLFLFKGGHHALVIAEIVEEWLDADNADQSLTVMVSIPVAQPDESGMFKPRIQQYTLNADSFRTEYADRPIFGLTAQGMTAYTDGKNIYMDTGRSYAIPKIEEFREDARRLALGLLLHGRVTKTENSYRIEMKTGELELYVSLTADPSLRTVDAKVILDDETSVLVSMVTKEPAAHPLPQPVLDAMVQTKMEPPMSLEEPLEVLLPVLEQLLPLSGDLTLGVECGILTISEEATLTVNDSEVRLIRKGAEVSFPTPELQPMAMALLLLRNGDFSISGTDATVQLTLPPETTAALCAALVPQIEGLNMTFGESSALLTIAEGAVSGAVLRTEGAVPFLVTTIPLSFTAELNIQ